MRKNKYCRNLCIWITCLVPLVSSFTAEPIQHQYDVAQFIQTYYQLLNQKNHEKANAMLSDRYTLFDEQGGKLNNMRELGQIDSGDKSHFIQNMEIRVVGDSAIATFKLITSKMHSNTKQANITQSVVTTVLEYTNEQWFIVHQHYTKTN